MLNRTITWDNQGILWEADPRHVDIILRQTGVTHSVTTPLVKEKANEAGDENDEELDRSSAEDYRSMAMRIGYLSQDWPKDFRSPRCDIRQC